MPEFRASRLVRAPKEVCEHPLFPCVRTTRGFTGVKKRVAQPELRVRLQAEECHYFEMEKRRIAPRRVPSRRMLVQSLTLGQGSMVCQ